MRHKPLAWLLAAVLVLAASVSCSSKPQSTPDVTAPPQSVGVFSMDKLGQYRGKIVLLNFWAIWCKWCRQEMPDLEAVYRQYRDQGVVVLAVNVTEDEAAIIDYARQLGLTFPMVRDTNQLASKAYKVQAFPTTVFIDRQGKVRYTQIGAMKKSFMEQQIEALLH